MEGDIYTKQYKRLNENKYMCTIQYVCIFCYKFLQYQLVFKILSDMRGVWRDKRIGRKRMRENDSMTEVRVFSTETSSLVAELR